MFLLWNVSFVIQKFLFFQQALENSGLSSIPVSTHSTDCSQAKTPGAQDQNPDVQTLSNHQADSNNAEQDKEQEITDKLDKKEKKIIKKKSPFLPGNIAPAWYFLCCKDYSICGCVDGFIKGFPKRDCVSVTIFTYFYLKHSACINYDSSIYNFHYTDTKMCQIGINLSYAVKPSALR